MSGTSSLEREFKLGAPDGFRLPSLEGLGRGISVAAEDVRRHTAVYYDTADLHLTRWDCGLRHRSSDGWTLKLAAAEDEVAAVRREFCFEGGPGRPPAAALDRVAAMTRGRALVPVAELRTVRRGVGVFDASGRAIAEVVDDHVTVLGGEGALRRFREVEVEFDGGCPPDVVEAILARLRAAGTGPLHRVSKHVRALGLESGVVPEVVVPGVDAGPSAGTVVRRAIASAVIELVRCDAGVRADEDPEELHRMRVAARRLRSALRTFGVCFDPEWCGSLVARLRNLSRLLGPVRDADVLALRLRSHALAEPDRPGVKALLERLQEQRTRELDRLLQGLRTPAYLGLLEDVVLAAREPHERPEARAPAREVLLPPIARRWQRLERAARRLPDPPRGEAAIHRVRIRAKHVRYACDAAAPVFGRPARRLGNAARRVQHGLGEHRDARMTCDWLRSNAERVPRDAAFAAGLLAERERRLARASLGSWRRSWSRARQRSSWL